jgi:hypothetical protein
MQATLRSVLTAVGVLRTLNTDYESARQCLDVIARIISDPPKIVGERSEAQILERRNGSDEFKKEYQLYLTRLRTLQSPGKADDQFLALEKIVADFENTPPEGLRARVDGLYQRLMLAGVAEALPLARRMRDAIVAKEVRLASIQIQLDRTWPKGTAITDANKAEVAKASEEAIILGILIKKQRWILDRMEKFAAPGDLRDLKESSQ